MPKPIYRVIDSQWWGVVSSDHRLIAAFPSEAQAIEYKATFAETFDVLPIMLTSDFDAVAGFAFVQGVKTHQALNKVLERDRRFYRSG